MSYEAHRVTIDGDLALIGHYASPHAVDLVDITDPTRPHQIARYRTDDWTYQVALSSGIAWVPTYNGGVMGLDVRNCDVNSDVTIVSEPEQPRAVLRAPFPNPTSGLTQLVFRLVHPGDARLEIFDVSGRLVAAPVSGKRDAGWHSVHWDTVVPAGALPAGLYFVRLMVAGEEALVQKMSVIR